MAIKVNENTRERADVIVVGGGAAGLSAAIVLSRSLRSVVIVDSGQPRNAPAGAAHNVFTRDGVSPLELIRLSRVEAESYGVRFVVGQATSGKREHDGLITIELNDGTRISARRVLLATGLVDELPDIPGLRELWGRDVLHCPYCHGWEVRGRRIGVLSTGPMSVHQALLFHQLSPHVTFFHNGAAPLTDLQVDQFSALGIDVIEGRVQHLVLDDGRLQAVAVEGRADVKVDALTLSPRFVARADLFEALGGTVSEHPAGVGTHVETDASGRTAVEGVWAAGNVTDLAAMVTASAGAGVSVAAAMNGDLVLEDAGLALLAPA